MDNTLSIAGAAADAKATGDAVADLKEDIEKILVKKQYFKDYDIVNGGIYPLHSVDRVTDRGTVRERDGRNRGRGAEYG